MAVCQSVFLFLLWNAAASASAPLLLPLSHTLSSAQFNTTRYLLGSSSGKSSARRDHHGRAVSLPLSPGSDYSLSLSVGSQPSQSITLYMDTGSDLVWFPCHPFRCILCEGKTPGESASSAIAAVNVTEAPLVLCKSSSCSAVHSSTSSADLCAMASCPLETIETSECSSACPPFYYAYGDGSLVARLYSGRLSIEGTPSGPSSLILNNFTFGCAHSALGEPVGVAGFGRGVLSFPAQLAMFSPQLGIRFSYCLVSHSFNLTRLRQPSPLILGKYELDDDGFPADDFVYIPMLTNPKRPYLYSVGLEGILVGNKLISAPTNLNHVDNEGNGGMVVDSGTTFTMLPASFYNAVVNAFDRRLRREYGRAHETEARTGLRPCYHLHSRLKLPSLTLRFLGNSTVALPRRNYFYDFSENSQMKNKVGCLMLMDGGDDEPEATLGNYQQQGFEVAYDLEKQRIGFAPRKCAVLWDRLNQSLNPT